MPTVDGACVPCDLDVFDRVINHLVACGLTLAAVMSRPQLDQQVDERLHDVIEELDATLVVIRCAAFERIRAQPARRPS